MGLIESEKMQRSAKTPIKGKGHWTLNDKPTPATLLSAWSRRKHFFYDPSPILQLLLDT